MSVDNKNIYYSLFSQHSRKIICTSILVLLVVTSSLMIYETRKFQGVFSTNNGNSVEKLGKYPSNPIFDPNEIEGNPIEDNDFKNISISETSSETLSESSDSSSNSSPLSWLELARNTTSYRINAENGTLEINTQSGLIILVNTPIEVRNSSNYIIESGLSNSLGNFSIDELKTGNYTVIVQQENNMTFSVEIEDSITTTITANFGQLEVITEDDSSNPVDATIELRNATDGTLEAQGLSTTASGNMTFFVVPMEYDIYAFYGYGQSEPSITVLEGELETVSFTFGDISGNFGGIEVESRGFSDMPLQTSISILNYTSGAYISSGSTDSTTGKRSWLLAPDVYTVEIREDDTITYESVTVEANVQTNISVQWGVLLVYNISSSDTRVDVYESTNTTRVVYHYIQAATQMTEFILHAGVYHVEYFDDYHEISIIEGQRTVIHPQVNTAPELIEVTASPERINANEETNVTVTFKDINYDYDNVTFTWTPNVGSISGVDLLNGFAEENVYFSTVTYLAPSSIETMYIDLFVDDEYNGNFSYRIYVSNQTGTIVVNNTELNGIGLSTTRIYAYYENTGLIAAGGSYTNSSGLVTFSEQDEDRYYLRAFIDTSQYSAVFELNTSNYYYEFKWGLIHVNSTGLNKQLIDTPIRVYNQTSDEYQTYKYTTTTDEGYCTFYLEEGIYKLEAYEQSDYDNAIWEYNVNLLANQELHYSFKFGVIAVYYLDDNGDPGSRRVDIYNRTTAVRMFYSYTSSAGLLVLLLAPYNNYSIVVDHNSTFDYIYEPLSIGENEGLNVGQFINHAPAITSYNASPSTVNVSESTTITITASDPDPLDILEYFYIPSMGTITGTGATVTYTAPVSSGFYYLNISVSDPNGAFDNITRSVSVRLSTINVNITDSFGDPIIGERVYLYDWTTGTAASPSYISTDINGSVTWSDIPESYYYLRARVSNDMYSYPFIADSENQYNHSFNFVTVFINSSAGNNILIQTQINVHPNGSTTTEATVYTSISDSGHVRLDLRPDYYDFEGIESNSLFFRDVDITSGNPVNLTLRWSEIKATSRTVMNMPLFGRIYVYNATTASSLFYQYAPAATGQVTFYVAPSDDYQIRIDQDSDYFENITVVANEITDVSGDFGVLKVLSTDNSGNPLSTSISVNNATTGAYITSASTGVDGVVIFYLAAGDYNVTNGTIVFSVFISELVKTDVIYGLASLNNYPVINYVTASPSRIGSSNSTIISVSCSDLDFDYDMMDVVITLSSGTLGTPVLGWIEEDEWLYQVEYFSPVSIGLYQLNITLLDGRGGIDFYMKVVSDRVGTLNALVQGNAFRPLRGYITLYRNSTGISVGSITTSTSDGRGSIVVEEDLYDIRCYTTLSNNEIWLTDIWIKGGDVLNTTFLWGELIIFSSGPGGEPVQNTRVRVRNQTTGFQYTYAYTDVNGQVDFILAPGLYEIELEEASSIIFNNVLILGGSAIAFGSDVPSVSQPLDKVFPENFVGNQISWTLNDVNPYYYNVTLDGTILIDDGIWTDGTVVTIDVDGLPIGSHYVVLYANDTTGYEQYDIVFITVISPLYAPMIVNPLNQSYIEVDIPIIVRNSTIVVSSWYQYYFEESWSINGSLSWNGSYWTLDVIWTEGTYLLRVYFSDSYGFETNNEIMFTVSYLDPLAIILISPMNNSVVRSNVPINITVDGSDVLFYNWDFDTENQTVIDVIGSTTLSLPRGDGLHSLALYITNRTRIWRYLYLKFTVDDTDPIIDSYYVSNNTEVGTETWIPFYVNDTHYEEFWYSWNGSTPVYTTDPGVWAPAVSGTWELEVYANDTAGNTAIQSVILNVLQAADLDLLFPNGGETIFGYCYIYWNTSLEININVSYSPDVGNTWIQIATSVEDSFYIWNTRTVNDGTNYLVRIVSTTIGIPGSDMSLSVFIIDNSGLRNDTEYYSLPEITVNITLSSPTSITIELLLNVSVNMVPGNDFFIPGLYIEVILENKSALELLAVSFSYADIEADLIDAGLSVDDDLKVYFFNENSSKWEEADNTEYDITRKLVIGYFNHTTVIGVLGRSESSPSPGAGALPWLIFLAAVVLFGVLGSVGLIYEHQMKIQKGETSILSKIGSQINQRRKKNS